MGSSHTRVLSKTVTRYLPIIALASSLYGASMICGVLVVFIAVIPYILVGLALSTHDTPFRTRLVLLVLYTEVLLLVAVKSGMFNMG